MKGNNAKNNGSQLRSGTWFAELFDNGRIKDISFSQELREMLGYSSQDDFPNTLKNLLEHIHPDDRDKILEMTIAAGVNGGTSFDLVLRIKTSGGSYITASTTVKLIRFPDGTPFMLHGMIVDISERVGTGQNDNDENAAATAFLFNISHKMLAQMNSIMEYTNILENNLAQEKLARDYIKKIRESHEFMMSLINNVLGTARIESGGAVVEESYHDIHKLMKSIATEFKGAMKEKKIKFTTSVKVKHPHVMVDFTKVKEILLNLISNAHKYTPSGGRVEVTVKELPHDKPGFALYQTTVSDTGIGIAQESIPHLYDAFSRNTVSYHDGILGTGLGMHLVKELVTLLEGSIDVKSVPGKGTDFIVTIPHRIAAYGNDDGDTHGPEGEAPAMRILLAEDNELNADIALSLLEEKGFAVDRAEDGAQCVEMLKDAKPGYYDIILMDIHMPNMDGYQATHAIRRMKNHGYSNIPIIAMTANASDADKREALLQGMNAHAAKPFDMDKLEATIYNVLEHKNYYIHSDALDTFKKKYTKMGCVCGFFVYRVDWDEKIIFADQATANIFGCANEEEFLQFVGGTFKTLVHADDIEHVQKAINQQQASSTANLDLVDYDIVRKDGEIRHLADIGYKVYNGEELVYFVYIADITDIKNK